MGDVEYLRSKLTAHPDFPKKVCHRLYRVKNLELNAILFFRQGIVFLDIFPILRDPLAFETLITHFIHHLTSSVIPQHGKIDAVVALDARGFLLGPIIALRLGAAFVPVRKQGKLPGQCASATYQKEYGSVSLSNEVVAIDS